MPFEVCNSLLHMVELPRKGGEAVRISRNLVLVIALLAVVGLVLVLTGPTEAGAANRAKITDPHEGQVYLYDGFDWIWMTPAEGVPVNDIAEADISWQGELPSYIGDQYSARRGIDVSYHQNEIDWAAVKAAGYDIAIIQAARRGYTKGGLTEDACFKANMEGALAAGLDVGIYFFSQAINVQEAIEEAEMTLRLIQPYRDRISMPVYYDWEKIYEYDTEPRTAGLDTTILSDCAVAFCETVRAGGYEPGIYFSRHTGYYGFDLSRLEGVSMWFALPEAKFPSFYYKVDAWQYSFNGSVPGISTPTDVNLFFEPKA